MPRTRKSGKLRTGSTAVLLVAFVGILGAVLWSSGYLPFRLKDDGIYGGQGGNTACAGELIDRPRLYLPEPQRLRSGHDRVTRVIDGDTIKVQRRGKDISVRLIGIDTDEVGRNRVNPDGIGWRAAMYVFDLLEDDPQVRLRFDKEREDKYGRTLAYVYLPDGRMLNEIMLEEGWAETLTIPPNTKHAAKFKELEDAARARGKRRWR